MRVDLQGDLISLLAVAYANTDREASAVKTMQSACVLADQIRSSSERAKIFHRIGAAAMRLAMPSATALQYLTHAVSLASEAGALATPPTRSYGALANLALFYDDDLTRSAWYARKVWRRYKPAICWRCKNGLLPLMNVEMTRGNAERLRKLERQFAEAVTSDTTRMGLVIPARALIAAWEERFGDAYRLLSTVSKNSASRRQGVFLCNMRALVSC